MKGFDQRDDRADGREMPITGEQFGSELQRPAKSALVRGSGREFTDRGGDKVAVDGWIQPCDHAVDDGDRVTIISVGASRAARLSGAVPGRDVSQLAADRAGEWTQVAGSAVPVLAAALQGPHRLAAFGSDRWRNLRARLTQSDQQVTDRPGCRGTTVGQRRRALGKKGRQPPRLRSSASDFGDNGLDLIRCQPIIDRQNQVCDEPDGVRDRATTVRFCHGSSTPRIRARRGRRSPMPASAPTAFLRQ